MPFVPGRIEFLGKHTDYCGGESIVCPIDRGFSYDFAVRDDAIVSITSLDSGEKIAIRLDDSDPHSGPARYVAEVIRRLRANFGRGLHRGIDLEFRSDLPQAAGLSSSSALMIMIFNALSDANRLSESEVFQNNVSGELELAEYLGCIENGQTFRELTGSAGVGTFGGSQDHAAIVAGRPGILTRFAFGPLRKRSEVQIPDEYCFIVASSGVVAEKTGAALEKYNRASRMVTEVVRAFGNGKTLANLIAEIGIAELEQTIRSRQFDFPIEDMIKRVRQFYEESFEIIPAVAELISEWRIETIGELVDRSQSNAERLLGNQVDETICLQRTARELGAIAASAFGAGFGGSVYALVRKSEAESFTSAWSDVYRARFPNLRAEFFPAFPDS
ncbi:MAG TPA: galactokinase family protein [Pyrinomonadaceae bacterium]|nr:galactokinase family protein [Pyrinomonadaceae bacterium]